ncbi:MAG TPA: hypothetical protein VGO92_07180 [Acidimicrobiales bacterium]|jgi:hypothetical protein|nr:hypothetical protein [Acidimicrobiales bacterium]
MERGTGDTSDLEPLPVDGPGSGLRPRGGLGAGVAGVEGGDSRGARGPGGPRGPRGAFDPVGPAGLHHGPSRRYRIAALGTTVLFVAAVGALLIVPGPESPVQALSRVRGFVRDERTAHFTAIGVSEYGTTSQGVGSTTTARTRTTGELRLNEWVHAVTEDGETFDEELVTPKASYYRSAASRLMLEAEQWVASPRGADGFGSLWAGNGAQALAGTRPSDLASGGDPRLAEVAGTLGTAPAQALSQLRGVAGAGALPFDLERLLARGRNVESVGDHRLRATAKVFDLLPDGLKQFIARMAVPTDATVTLTVDYGPGGRLDVLTTDTVTDFDGDRQTEHEEIRFSRWGEGVALSLPRPDQIDRTPGIDEAALARISDMTVLAPARLPAGWQLTEVDVVPRDDDVQECEAVTLTYREVPIDVSRLTSDDDPPTIEVTSVPAACGWRADNEPDLAGVRRVRTGGWEAQVVDNVEDNTYSYLTKGMTAVLEVNATHVLVSTNQGEAVLLATAAALAPLDLAAQPVWSPGPASPP